MNIRTGRANKSTAANSSGRRRLARDQPLLSPRAVAEFGRWYGSLGCKQRMRECDRR